MTHILVTGGAGYLGSTLVPELLSAGYYVTVVDNMMHKQPSLNHVCFAQNLTVVRGDIRIETTLKPLLEVADYIIPLAAFVGAPLCERDPIGAKTTNNGAIKMMLRMVSNHQRIIMPTTNSAYGHGDENNFCTEDSPLNPVSSYAVDKVEIEKELLRRENSISLRLATVFGMSPRMRIDLLVNDFVYRAVKEKFVVLFESHFKRNYIHVKDIARVFLHSIDKFEEMRGEIYNVGLSDANLSKLELCHKIRDHLPDFLVLENGFAKDPDQRNYIVSNEKIEKTGFKPIFSLDDGIQELIRGYQFLNNYIYGNIS